MEIRLYIEEGPGSNGIREMMTNLVSSAALKANVDISTVKIVGLATEETYGSAITELFPGSGYTDRNGYLGVGKTETNMTLSGPEHRILFNAYVFELCLRGYLGIGENIGEWPADLQYGPFIISHEIGHCRYNQTAPRDIEKLNTLRAQQDDFDSINEHQLSVLIGEVGACYFGDRYYSKFLLNHACDQDLSPLANIRRELEAAKAEKDIHGVAYLANGLTWLYLIQYSKIAIGKFHTPFDEEPIEPPDGLSDFAELHALLSYSIAEFCDSNLEDIDTFRKNIALAREVLLEHHLHVKILKENNQWGCYWT